MSHIFVRKYPFISDPNSVVQFKFKFSFTTTTNVSIKILKLILSYVVQKFTICWVLKENCWQSQGWYEYHGYQALFQVKVSTSKQILAMTDVFFCGRPINFTCNKYVRIITEQSITSKLNINNTCMVLIMESSFF